MNAPQNCPKCQQPLPADAPAGLCPNCLVAAGFESAPAGDSQAAPTLPSPAASGFQPLSLEEMGRRFPQLEILGLLGKGGMGAVYKARQRGLDRLVAVKILPPEVSRAPSFTERFAREAKALARLSHPHIVTVHDFGQTDGLCYFIMEYIDGVNLRQAIQSEKIDPPQALAIVPQICEALQFAHDEGIVHRDIKPENVLIDKRGRVKIADFGLAKLMASEQASGERELPDPSLTGTQQVMGTLRYMAPEQMFGTKSVDHRADIYSLGVVFYELLTGELPIGRFAPPSKKVQIDVRFDEIVLRALEADPEQRYQHASDVKTDVEAVQHGATYIPTRIEPTKPTTSENLEREVLAYLPKEKINAVAIYRKMHGANQSDALEAVEAIARKHGVASAGAHPWWWNVVGLAIAVAIFGVFALKIIDLSPLVWRPLLALAAAPLGLNAWKYRGLHRGRRDAIIFGVWMFILFVQPLKQLDPELLLEQLYASTGTAKGRHDEIFIGGIFLLIALGFSAWVLRYSYLSRQLPSAKGGFVRDNRWIWFLRESNSVASAETGDARLSKTTVVGAIWAALGVVSMVIWGLWNYFHAAPPTPAAEVFTAQIREIVYYLPKWPFFLLALTAPFGATILGAIALARINRSQGKLYGQRLAFADMTFYPLLLVAAAITFGGALVAKVLLAPAHPKPTDDPPAGISFFAGGIPGAIVAAIVCFYLGLAAWRAISGFTKPELTTTPKPAFAGTRRHLALCVLLSVITLWFVLEFGFPVVTMIQGPDFPLIELGRQWHLGATVDSIFSKLASLATLLAAANFFAWRSYRLASAPKDYP